MEDFQHMYKKVALYDFFMIIILAIILSVVNRELMLPCILGLTVAINNFFISGKVTLYAFEKNKMNSFAFPLFFLKVIITAVLGVIVYLNTHNKDYLIAYMGGYISHFVPLVIYGLSLKDK